MARIAQAPVALTTALPVPRRADTLSLRSCTAIIGAASISAWSGILYLAWIAL